MRLRWFVPRCVSRVFLYIQSLVFVLTKKRAKKRLLELASYFIFFSWNAYLCAHLQVRETTATALVSVGDRARWKSCRGRVFVGLRGQARGRGSGRAPLGYSTVSVSFFYILFFVRRVLSSFVASWSYPYLFHFMPLMAWPSLALSL